MLEFRVWYTEPDGDEGWCNVLAPSLLDAVKSVTEGCVTNPPYTWICIPRERITGVQQYIPINGCFVESED